MPPSPQSRLHTGCITILHAATHLHTMQPSCSLVCVCVRVYVCVCACVRVCVCLNTCISPFRTHAFLATCSILLMLTCTVFSTEYEEEEDSEEESGKDWDELEKEAVKGTLQYTHTVHYIGSFSEPNCSSFQFSWFSLLIFSELVRKHNWRVFNLAFMLLQVDDVI